MALSQVSSMMDLTQLPITFQNLELPAVARVGAEPQTCFPSIFVLNPRQFLPAEAQ